LHAQVRIDESVTDAAVPAFLLQPLVENAIRHNPAGERIEVTVSVNREGDELVLRIVDNGPGMTGATSDGIGLSNTRERLHQLYGAAGRLDFSNGSDGGLTVTIRLPFETLPVEAVYDTARADR
jgi:two-component system sensor histidine kinase AlgZ